MKPGYCIIVLKPIYTNLDQDKVTIVQVSFTHTEAPSRSLINNSCNLSNDLHRYLAPSQSFCTPTWLPIATSCINNVAILE